MNARLMTHPYDFQPNVDLREDAMHMLTQLATPVPMTRHEARIVVHAMRPIHLVADTLVFSEGDAIDNDYLVLVLEGQLRVVTSTGATGEEVVISVVGRGEVLGEMGVIDGGARSATCTTLTDCKLAVLSRASLLQLIEVYPTAAARLALCLSKCLTERLREGNRRLRMLNQVTRAVQAELDAAHKVNRRLLAAA